MIDTENLTEVRAKKQRGWTTSFFIDAEGVCVAKHCSRCHQVKPSDRFSSASSKRYGLNSRCKLCSTEYHREYGSSPSITGEGTRLALRSRRSRDKYSSRTTHQIEEDQARLRPEGLKRCKTCTVLRPLTEFHVDKSRADGLQARCKTCTTVRDADRYTKAYISYWETHNIPLRCYLCDGPYEDIEHIIPLSLPAGQDIPENTRPSCTKCNRGLDGKWHTPLEVYIFKVNHPHKSRAKILHEMVMADTWPFALTTPEEFLALQEVSIAYDFEPGSP